MRRRLEPVDGGDLELSTRIVKAPDPGPRPAKAAAGREGVDRMVALLTHPGRLAVDTADVVAPSPVACVTPRDGGRARPTPRTLETWEIEEIVQGYRRAALDAVITSGGAAQ